MPYRKPQQILEQVELLELMAFMHGLQVNVSWGYMLLHLSLSFENL